MKHVKTKMLGLLVVVLLVGVGGCKKQYTCYSNQSQYVICNLGNDTVRYLATGYLDYQIRVRAYYEKMGYTCSNVSFTLIGSTSYDMGITTKDAEYLEMQGFVCTEK